MAHPRRVGPGFYVVLLLIALATFVLHEGAHWAMGRALGHDMTFGLNGSGTLGPAPPVDHHLISAAGVLVTVAQGVVGLVLVWQRNSLVGYGLLYFAALMRLMAAVVSLFNPNDEARISEALGLGQWTLPVAVVGLLGVMAVVATRRLGLSWRTNLLTWLTATAALSAIVGLDMMLKG